MFMKVAVITPLCHTPPDWLGQCLDSVARQTAPCTHFLVCDGSTPGEVTVPARAQVIRLPLPHGDAGLTARAIGAVSAIRQGCDALAFLDADHWYDPDQVRFLCEEHRRTGAAVCSSGRTLHALDGEALGPCPDVDGTHFVDVNCLLLTRAAFGVVSAWYLLPWSRVAQGERVLWQAIRDARLTHSHHERPTVHYRTRSAAHYRHFGKEPPADALPGAAPAPALPARPAVHLEARQPPAARPRVSLCLIARDEEANLPDCLRSVAGLVDEVIVADTGSADRTREVAREFGAKVVDCPWQDSFAAARNEALRHASGDWILWLDADECLDADNRERLRRLLGRLDDDAVYLMKQWSEPDYAAGSALVVDQARLFRKRPGVGWRYRVHEQILPALREAGVRLVATGIIIKHRGYHDAALRRRKLERNLRLLLLEHREQPDDTFTRYNLGAAYMDLGDFEAALPHLRRCLETAPAGAAFLAKTYVLLAYGLRALGRPEEGLECCRQGRERYPDDMELCFAEGLLLQAGGDAAGAQRCFEQILQAPAGPCLVPVDSGLRGHLARHQLALAHRAQGRPAEAEAQWRAAVAVCPHYGPAWLGLAELLLDQGRTAEVEGLINRLSQDPGAVQTAAVLRARVGLARGDFAAARHALAAALAQAPHSLWLRMVLGEVLLLEGKDLDEAERNLAIVLDMDPKHKSARDRLQQVQQRKAQRTAAAPNASR
jgi:tetratricopeptide (TPR) repeat protein/GT2 family glycosyltransferase